MKFFLIPITVIFFDQISKIFVKQYFINQDLIFQRINILGDFLKFTFLENPGIAFGIDTSNYHIYITLLTILAIIFIFFQLFHSISTKNFDAYPLSFILGGAIGNCIDRVLVFFPNLNYNGVIDFIDVGIGNFRWYIFNIADAAITVGLFLFLYNFFMNKENNSIEKKI